MTQLVVRIDDDLAKSIDRLIAEGVVGSRSDVVRRASGRSSSEPDAAAPQTRSSPATRIVPRPNTRSRGQCAASFDNLQPIRKTFPTSRIGRRAALSATERAMPESRFQPPTSGWMDGIVRLGAGTRRIGGVAVSDRSTA
jgi:hypothetical protein